jgi:hypothetical protein
LTEWVLITLQKKQQQQDDAAQAATSKKKKVTPAQLRAQKGRHYIHTMLFAHTTNTSQIWKSYHLAQQ